MTRRKTCSNCGLIPFEKKMRKLADQNFYCNDCREALVGCSAKELKNLGHPYCLNFKKLKNERNQQRNKRQELTALRQEKNKLVSQLANLQIALDKANQEIQNEREIHQDSLKIQDDWYRRLPPDSNNLKNILVGFTQKYLKLNWKNKVRKQRIKELEDSLELVKQLANLQIQEFQEQLHELQQENTTLRNNSEVATKEKKKEVKQLVNLQIQEFQEQLNELQQENTTLRNNLEVATKEKKEVQEDTQKVIQNHQQEILQLQQQVQHQELPKSINRLNFWRRG